MALRCARSAGGASSWRATLLLHALCSCPALICSQLLKTHTNPCAFVGGVQMAGTWTWRTCRPAACSTPAPSW
jgi:hypothetical protein